MSSEEIRTLKRSYQKVFDAERFGWGAGKLFNIGVPLDMEHRQAFIWEQRDSYGHWQWLAHCTSSNPVQQFTVWGTQAQCLVDASKWLECTVVMEDDNE